MADRLALALVMGLAWAVAAGAAPFAGLLGRAEVLAPEQAFGMRLTGVAEHARLELDIAPGYSLYRDKLRARVPGGAALSLVLPPGTRVRDDPLGATEVYRGAQVIEAPLPRGTRTVEVEYQGCAERRLCYPPARRLLRVGGA